MKSDNDYQRYLEMIKARKRAIPAYSKLEGRKPNIIRCSNTPAQMLIQFLDRCPIGEGLLYEHFVVDAIGKILAGLVDTKCVLLHGACQGGEYDMEFSFCTENLHKFPFWNPWYYEYVIRAILIETKNKKEKVGPDASRQIKGYIDGNKTGRFGMLVSRNGFTPGAMKELNFYAKHENCLILPIEHRHLKILLRLSMRGAYHVYKYLRRRETQLLRFT